MAKRVKLIRHVEAEADNFVGVEGEITVDLTNKTFRMHDQVTKGGYATARADLANVASASDGNDGKMTASQVGALSSVIAGLAQEIADRIADVDAEEARAIAAEAVLQSDINTRLLASEKAAVNGVASLNASSKVVQVALQADSATTLNSLTSSIAELNKLDGFTGVVADLNKLTALTGNGAIDAFPAGTLMLFQQTAAPSGWTKQVTHNDKALRVVSGAAASGGTNAFSTAFNAAYATAGHALSIAELPAHNHSVSVDGHTAPYTQVFQAATTAGTTGYVEGTNIDNVKSSTSAIAHATAFAHTVNETSVGSGSTHSHTVNLAVQYVDIIIASKN